MGTAENILIAIVILVILYVVYRYFFKDTSTVDLVGQAIDGTKQSKLPLGDSSSDVQNFTYSLWFRIDDWNYKYGQYKNVMLKEVDGSSYYDNNRCPPEFNVKDACCSPNVYFDKFENNLIIDVTYKNRNGALQIHSTVVENIPIQKMTCLIISVDTRSIDVYLDGKLVKSSILPNIIYTKTKRSATNEVILCTKYENSNRNGFAGIVSNVQFKNSAINPREAYRIYRDGVSTMPSFDLGNYSMKFSVLDKGNEVTSFTT